MTYSNLNSKYSRANRTNRKDSLFLFRGRNKFLKENDDKKASNSILHRLSFLKNPALKMVLYKAVLSREPRIL